MVSIRLVQSFDVVHSHPAHHVYLDVASHFESSLPLHFKLLDSPAWLTLSEQGVLTGVAPAVKYDNQFVVTVAAWNSQDLLTQKFFINVIPETMLDSLKEPLLVLSMMNKPYFPHKKPLLTRDVLTYIFGYYHSKPHGEQFFEKLREKANLLSRHLPDLLSTESLVEFFENLPAAEQYALLEPTVESRVFEEAQHAELPSEVEKMTATESLGFSDRDTQAHEHTLLEYLFAHLAVNHAEMLEKWLHEAEHKRMWYEIRAVEKTVKVMPHTMSHEIQFEHFKEVMTKKHPELEKKLESLAPKYPVLQQLKLTDQELQECCLQARHDEHEINEKFQGLRAFVHMHGLRHPDDFLHDEMLAGFFLELESVLARHCHERGLDLTEFSGRYFFPHPTPPREVL